MVLVATAACFVLRFRPDFLTVFSASASSATGSAGASASVGAFAASSFSISSTKVPLPNFKAVSTASVSRPRMLGPAVNRSTTTSTLWRLVRSRLISLESETVSPSTRARVNPCFNMSMKRSLCSPFWLRTTGANTEYWVSSFCIMIAPMIWSRDWAEIG